VTDALGAESLFWGALLTGLLGSGHCVGMCGALVGALSLSRSQQAGPLFHVLYNAGRITTYVLLGYVVAWLGLAVAYTGGIRGAGWYAMIGADLFVIAVGLGTVGADSRLNMMRLEFPSPVRALATAAGYLRRAPGSLAALPLGLLMGLIPCGFLYAVLLNAALTAEPSSGALVMAGFGLGTAPSLLLFGTASHLLSTRARGWMLRGAGLVVALMGAYNLWRHLVAGGICH
jgi:sulfite exporter TauE/SafE